MAKTVGEVLGALELRAPSGTAEAWDNVGLLVGDPDWKTSGAVISIDLTRGSIQAAKRKGYRLIVNHHPCIFPKSRGLARLTPPSLAFEAARAGIAVISSHTNFDQCALEVVDGISQGLKLTPRGRLLDHDSDALMKLVVFVPSSHLEAVRSALSLAGAGHIGNYDSCTFGSQGEGTFRGREGAQPFIGRPGRLETAVETRLETVFPRGLAKPVLKAMREAHPYEEVAYDLYPVEQRPSELGLVRGLGYGFWGEFPRAKSFSEVIRGVKSLFDVDGFWVTDPRPSRVKRVAFVAGKGASFLKHASSIGCDLFITGEAGYHVALEGARNGTAVMELGHRESERFFLSTMRKWLSSEGLRSVELNQATQRISM